MKILLSDITDDGLDLELEFEEPLVSEPLRLLSPVKARLRIEKVSSEVFAKGEVSAAIELQCSRCLKKFSKTIEANVNVVYHPVEELKGEEKHEIKEDELDMGFYKGEELDVHDIVTEQIILSVPMKPLCSESCKGICPKCGADLNVNTCSCGMKEPDPRLAVLKKLINDRKE